MSYCVGVDLGTTAVRAAVCDEAGVRVVALGDRSVDVSAAVYLRHDGTLITGRRAASKSVTNPGRVARQFTRLLGSAESVIIGGQPFTPPELLGALLRDVLHQVTSLEGAPPVGAVLTHPVGWDTRRIELLREVAVGAGLSDPVLVSAAAATGAHWMRGVDLDDAAVAVYDLGGGTFDAAVLRGPDLPLAAGAVGRDLGGMDFDRLLLGFVDSALDGAVSALEVCEPSNATALARIRQDCIRAKEALTEVPEAYVPVFLPGRHTDVRVRRTDLENLIAGQIAATADELAGVLASVDVSAHDCAAVLVVGGSSRIPIVARTVSERLGREVTVADGSGCGSSPEAAAATSPESEAGSSAAAGWQSLAAAGWQSFAAAGAAAIAGAARGWNVGTRPATAPSPAFRVPAPRTSATHPTPRPRPTPWPTDKPHPTPRPRPTKAPTPVAPTSPASMFPAVRPSPPPAPPPRPLPPPHSAQYARRRRRLVVAGGTAAALVIGLWLARPWHQPPPEPSNAALVLTVNTLHATEPYFAYASGFEPGELVVLSRIGPTTGALGGGSEADETGSVRLGPVKDGDLPGDYQIVARGSRSDRAATAPLQVLPSRSGE